MKHRYTYILLFLFLGIGYGCEHSGALVPEDDPVGEKIILGAQPSASIAAATRVETGFKVGTTIGVLAATALADPATQTDWSQYADINNARASVSGTRVDPVSGLTLYQFTWETQKYWPFDGSDLYFMAYSPISTGENHYLIDALNSSLYVSLQPNMPDIMYASGNMAPQPYNKNSGPVDLGEFKHALSQLTIRVIAGENLSPNIKVTNLSVSTPGNVGMLPLQRADDGFNITFNNSRYTDVLIGGQTEFLNGEISRDLLLFPDTQDVTMISINLLDTSNGATFTGNYMMSFFANDIGDEPITLERAKNTVLRITVNMANVDNPNQFIDLKGLITDWTYSGQFGININ